MSRRRVTCVPMVVGDSIALVRGSFTDEEVAEYRAAARAARAAMSDPPATVAGSQGGTVPRNPGKDHRTMSTDSMFDTPPATGGDKFVNADHEGRLLVVKVTGTGKDTFDNGEAEYIVADVTVVDGPEAGEEYTDAWLFGRVLFGQLKRRVGRTLLGRLVKGEASKGKSAPWQLDPATEEETTYATRFMTERMRPPSAGSANAGGTASSEPAATDLGDTPPWERRG